MQVSKKNISNSLAVFNRFTLFFLGIFLVRRQKGSFFWLPSFVLFLIVGFGGLYLNQTSVEKYWQQQHHQPSIFQGLQNYSFWRYGQELRRQLLAQFTPIANPIMVTNSHIVTDKPMSKEPTDIELTSVSNETDAPVIHLATAEPTTPINQPITKPIDSSVTATATPIDQPIAEPIDSSVTVAASPIDQPIAKPIDSSVTATAIPIDQPIAKPIDSSVTVTATPIDQPIAKPIDSSVTVTATPIDQPIAKPIDSSVTVTAIPIDQPIAKPVVSSATVTATPISQPVTKPIGISKNKQKVMLKQEDFVVFLGDSMMLSLAPTVQKWLKKAHNINSINMGRHSTGLTNQSYFDWPKKAETSLPKYKNLKLVVVMLGANDPWGINIHHKKIPFGTDAWDTTYATRMQRIINAANQQGASVIWFGLPYMKLNKYNKKIEHINSVMQKTTTDKAIFIPLQQALGNNNAYSSTIKINDKWVSVRQKDGIHLNTQGNLILLNLLKKQIDIGKKK